MKKPTSIYAIRCNPTGRLYIGMSTQVEERIQRHMDELRLRSHNVKELQTDYDAHGSDSFSFFVLEEGLTDQEARQRRTLWTNTRRATRILDTTANIHHMARRNRKLFMRSPLALKL